MFVFPSDDIPCTGGFMEIESVHSSHSSPLHIIVHCAHIPEPGL